MFAVEKIVNHAAHCTGLDINGPIYRERNINPVVKYWSVEPFITNTFISVKIQSILLSGSKCLFISAPVSLGNVRDAQGVVRVQVYGIQSRKAGPEGQI